MAIQVTSRKLSAVERQARYWPSLERVVAYALDNETGLGAKAYGISRHQAEKRAMANLKDLMKARRTILTRRVG